MQVNIYGSMFPIGVHKQKCVPTPYIKGVGSYQAPSQVYTCRPPNYYTNRVVHTYYDHTRFNEPTMS